MIQSYHVYMLVTPKDKAYIGYTSLTPEERFAIHVKNSRKKKGKCVAIEGAIREHGAANILVYDVYKCWDKTEAANMEIRLVEEHKSYIKKNGYNLTKGGDGGVPTDETREKMRKSSAARLYKTPKGPRAATAEQIEDAIHWVQRMNLGISKTPLSMICGDLLGVSHKTIKDHLKRMCMSFDDGRRVATDEQIQDALHWVMSQEFSSMMNKTLIGDLVGNIFGSSRILLRKYLNRHDTTHDIPSGYRGPGPSFQHTEGAKKAISTANSGRKKSEEELKQRQEKRWNNVVIKYANIGIDVSKDSLDKVIAEYSTACKAAKYLTRQCPGHYGGIRAILRFHLKNSFV
ncbi:GIY-YIG catalytic domain-containing endonuclease [Acanthocystis turfacea Chlorella virus GM0701.1]|nr:GIY-YIG catalytic domain-containing endonuclease [Acanthocystis turfacea Chlorella virus GM0701.1]